jgi:hypothetical protein
MPQVVGIEETSVGGFCITSRGSRSSSGTFAANASSNAALFSSNSGVPRGTDFTCTTGSPGTISVAKGLHSRDFKLWVVTLEESLEDPDGRTEEEEAKVMAEECVCVTADLPGKHGEKDNEEVVQL